MISDEPLDLTSEVKNYGREFSVAFLLGCDNSNLNALQSHKLLTRSRIRIPLKIFAKPQSSRSLVIAAAPFGGATLDIIKQSIVLCSLHPK